MVTSLPESVLRVKLSAEMDLIVPRAGGVREAGVCACAAEGLVSKSKAQNPTKNNEFSEPILFEGRTSMKSCPRIPQMR